MGKQKKIALVLLVLLVLSYMLLLWKGFSLDELDCTLTTPGENYEKKNTVVVGYDKDKVLKLTYKETFSSDTKQLLDIKKAELEAQKYTVTTSARTVNGTKIEKVDRKYQETVDALLKSGYTCK